MPLPKTITVVLLNFGFIFLPLAFLIKLNRGASEIDLPLVNPYNYWQSQTVLGIHKNSEEGFRCA